MHTHPLLAQLRTAATLPWNAFVAAFLYYTLLAALAFSGAAVRGPVIAGAYGAPLVIAGLTVAFRVARLGAAWVGNLVVPVRTLQKV